MPLNPKRTQRVVMYLNEKEYVDLLKSAARFDKRPGDFARFGLLRDMYGMLGMDATLHNENHCAFEAHDE
ncbi:MAG: hypothetical protein HQ445_05505 [Polaromonas sp.]|nr:hypothetical protein [Polaromonas sp.]